MYTKGKTKLISLLLAIIMVVGCVPAFAISAAADTATYYLKGGATGGNGSEAAPYGTLAEVVAAAEAAGLNVAGNEITVKVIKADSDAAYLGANALYYNPYGWKDGNYYCSSLVKHNATLIIESADPEARALIYASYGNKDNLYRSLRLGGPVVFRNIDIGTSRESGWFELFSNGFSATYENVKFYYKDGTTPVAKNTIGIYQGGYNHNNGAGVEEGGTLTIDAATLSRIDYVISSGYSENNVWYHDNGYQSFDEDVKVVVTGDSLANLRIGGANSAKNIAYYKNLNLILNGTTVANLYNRNNIAQFTEGHAMQIIYNDGASIATETQVYEGLYRYDIFVEEGGALDTTDVAGTYAVTLPEGKKYAIATDAEGESYVSSGDTLTVGEPGVYNVTFVNRYEGQPYYVKGGATGTGESEESPAGTISALVAQIEADGLNVEGEEVVVKVMKGGSGYIYYNYENGALTVTPYKATLIFESQDPENISLLAISKSSTRGDHHFRISGPSVFRNIGIYFNRSTTDWMETYTGGYDVSFENVTLYGNKNGTVAKSETTNHNTFISKGSIDALTDGEGGTLIVDAATLNNTTIGYISATAGANISDITTFDEDVKIVLGAGQIHKEFRLGGAPKGTNVAFKKNINIVLNGTQIPLLYNRDNIAAMTDGHALQIIYNNGATITAETADTNDTKAINLARYDIFVENIAGAALDTTDVAGTYTVAYPAGKTIAYFYAVDASGNYDGLTPVYYTTEETITVGKTGRYEVGFASSVSAINVEIVNDYAEFDGWANNEAAGTLTPIPAASSITETTVSDLDTVVYTADVIISAGKKAIISAIGDVSETTLVELFDGGLEIGGYTVAGTFGTGTYGVKFTIAPASKALFVEVTKPDGTVIRRGNDLMLAGNTKINTITAKTSEEDAVKNIKAVSSDFVADSYTINATEPVLTGFEANVFNIVTSYNADAKTTRNFAFTALKSFLAEDETLVVEYNVKGSEETLAVDAVEKANPTSLYNDRYFLEADITGLTAGTTYEYRIGKKGSEAASDWSDVYSFTTEAEGEDNFSFIAISDTQGEAWSGRGFMYAQAAINEALEDVKNPAFILNAGDVIEGDNFEGAELETMWSQYFKAMGDTLKSVPHFAAMGNHDYFGHGSDTNYLFNLHFNHPDNGSIANWNLDGSFNVLKKNKSESSYSFDYGNVHFVVLNTGVTNSQYKDSNGQMQDPSSFWYLGTQSWVKADLEASDAEWKVVIAHIPAYDSNGVTGNWSKHAMNTYFEELGVDLVIEGHAHYNTRTYPMKGGEAVRTDGNPDIIKKGEGTVYSIIGSTTTNHDKLKDNLNENYVSVFSPASEMPVYATVDVTDYTLTYTVKQLDGFVVDKFTIEKEKGEEFYTPETLGAQIRIPTKENPRITQGLRFVGEISTDLYDELAESGILPEDADATELGFGSVILPKNYLEEGEALTKQTADAAIVPAVNLLSKDDDTVKFTVCLVNIPEANYTRDYCVVPYVTLMVDGEEVTYYGEMLTANVYQIALLACGENSQENEYTKEYLKANVIDVVEANN